MPSDNTLPQSSTRASSSSILSSSTDPRKRLGLACLIVLISLTALAGCTTYTWPDGSQKTVLGVPAEEENSRYEEDIQTGTQYRLPGEVPPKKQPQE